MTYTVPLWLILALPVFSGSGMVTEVSHFVDSSASDVTQAAVDPSAAPNMSESTDPDCGAITLQFKVGGRARSQITKTC